MQRSGELAENMAIHDELIAVKPDELASIPTVLGVAGGVEKAEAIVAALKGKRINALVTEESTARAMLALLG
ncbi:Transcriptional regulator LsrR [compost metagenome]